MHRHSSLKTFHKKFTTGIKVSLLVTNLISRVAYSLRKDHWTREAIVSSATKAKAIAKFYCGFSLSLYGIETIKKYSWLEIKNTQRLRKIAHFCTRQVLTSRRASLYLSIAMALAINYLQHSATSWRNPLRGSIGDYFYIFFSFFAFEFCGNGALRSWQTKWKAAIKLNVPNCSKANFFLLVFALYKHICLMILWFRYSTNTQRNRQLVNKG